MIENFYSEIGSDAKDVIKRLGGESTVVRFVKKFAQDKSFFEMKSAMENGDTETAFRAAHTLKGISMNLGFDRLYEASYDITEALRTKETDKAAQKLPEVEKRYNEIICGIQRYYN